MFTFSKIHAAQFDIAVMQILVFSSIYAQGQFQKRYGQAMSESSEGAEVSDTGFGATYKLRAVLDSDGKRLAIIRCGATGYLLWEGCVQYDSVSQALEAAFKELINNISELTPVFSK